MSDLREKLIASVERAYDQGFDTWLEKWGTPAGICTDAPGPPSKSKTKTGDIADAILSDLDAQGLVIVPREPTIAQWDIWWGPIFMSLPDRARERLSCDDWHKTGEVMKAEWLKAAEQ